MLSMMIDQNWFAFLQRPETLAVGGGLIVAIIAILAGTWRHVEQIRADAELKHSMIDKGMSAEEIQRVLSARSEKR